MHHFLEHLPFLTDSESMEVPLSVAPLLLFQNEPALVQNTADAAFTHRNTIKYRIIRIEELLHIDLQNASARLNLHLALYLYHFILMK